MNLSEVMVSNNAKPTPTTWLGSALSGWWIDGKLVEIYKDYSPFKQRPTQTVKIWGKTKTKGLQRANSTEEHKASEADQV